MSRNAGRKNSAPYNDLFHNGLRLQGQHLQIFFKRDNIYNKPPLFCVAKHIYKNRPQRNRLRRLLKEAYRKQAQKLEGYYCALMIASAKAQLSTLQQELKILIAKVLRKYGQDPNTAN